MKVILWISMLIIFMSGSSVNLPNSNDCIIEIGENSRCGDKGGRFHIIKITKDSTTRISGTRDGKFNDTIAYLTNKDDWQKLITILNIHDFTKIKSKELGNLAADGYIKFFYVKTSDSIYCKSGLNFNKKIMDAESIQELLK